MHRFAPLAFFVAALAANATPAAAEVTVKHVDSAEPAPHYRHRPGPRLMMPLRFDIGMAGADTDAGYLPGIELRAGIHWASLSPTPTNFDIGAGAFVAALAGPKNATMTTNDDDVVYGGLYLEAGETLSHGNNWRTWASGRVEYLGSDAFGNSHSGFGAAGRLSAELYASGVGVEPSGFFLGTYAIGVYAEAGLRDLGPGVSALQVSGGLTFRTPLVFAP